MKNLNHCFIAPTNYLHLIPENSNYHLLLAHLLTDKRYCEFYRNRRTKGDYIIIDNGAFEFKRPLEAHELYKLINESGVKPHIVVAPDYPFEHWKKTVQSTEAFSKEYHKYFDKDVKLMAVPQSNKGDYQGWVSAYEALTKIEHVDMIGMSILGIPNAFCSLTGTEDISFNRIFATIYMKERGLVAPRVLHHYLGLGSNVREVLVQRELGVAFSNDSSSAIWHGINGIMYDNTGNALVNGKIKKEVDFNLPFNNDKKILDYIAFNIHYMQTLCSEEYTKSKATLASLHV